MTIMLLVILLAITLVMIGVILLQRSEGGGLGIGGGNMGGLMSTRGTTNFLTRLTGVLASFFFGICLLLAILSNHGSKKASILETIAAEEEVDLATLKEKAEGREDNAKETSQKSA